MREEAVLITTPVTILLVTSPEPPDHSSAEFKLQRFTSNCQDISPLLPCTQADCYHHKLNPHNKLLRSQVLLYPLQLPES